MITIANKYVSLEAVGNPDENKNMAVSHRDSLPLDPNKSQMNYTLEIIKIGSTVDKTDPVSLQKAFQKYLQLSGEKGYRIGEMNAYLAMGITKKTASLWYNRLSRADDPRFHDLIEKVKAVCSAYREQLMLDNKIAPPTGIWWQKVFDEMSEVPPPLPEAQQEQKRTPEDVRRKLKELMDIDE